MSNQPSKASQALPTHTRQAVTQAIPNELTVTKAAELLGVGRPTLSELLNGRSELSDAMLVRLHLVFGAPITELAHARYLDQLARVEALEREMGMSWGKPLPYRWNERRAKEKAE